MCFQLVSQYNNKSNYFSLASHGSRLIAIGTTDTTDNLAVLPGAITLHTMWGKTISLTIFESIGTRV